MWEVFKILVGALFILLLVSPIVVLVVKMARRIGQLVHEWQLSKAETEAAWAETHAKQISWHGADERGFTGLVYDSVSNTMTDTDTGRSWIAGQSPGVPHAQTETAQRQRLFASLSGVKVEKKDVQMIAGGGSTARFKVEAETLLNEPQRKTDG